MILLGWWTKREDIFKDFSEPDMGQNILFAWYDDPYGYSGEAFVIYEKDGKLFSVEGGHCSCYGLEDQWEPVETDVGTLRLKVNEGRGSGLDMYREDLRKMLDSMEN